MKVRRQFVIYFFTILFTKLVKAENLQRSNDKWTDVYTSVRNVSPVENTNIFRGREKKNIRSIKILYTI